jgi:mycothiol synthase
MTAPVGFTTRPATAADTETLADLINTYDRVHLDEPDHVDAGEVEGWWAQMNLENDTRLYFDAAGALAAAAAVHDRGADVVALDAYTHPEHAGRGLGAAMLQWLEDEAAARGRRPRASALAADRPAAELLAERGFEPIRHFYIMSIDLESPPAEPDWPAGFTVSTMRAGEERTVHAVVEETFAEHWGHDPRTFEEWSVRNLEQPWWDPSLVYLVREGDDEVVAVETAAIRFGSGFVNVLGTRKPWRGLGLGKALLLQAFGDLYGRGERRITLAVDAGNETGALQLYANVGMQVAWQSDVYEKRL